MRGNRLTIDPAAFAGNVGATRRLIGDGVALMQVVKGDGYGLGLDLAVALGRAAGVDGFCAGTPEEALRVRSCAPDAAVLLFTGCAPDRLPELAGRGIVLSINGVEALDALPRSGPPAAVYLELDCGFGRFGLDADALAEVLARASEGRRVDIQGAYTHFGRCDGEMLARHLEAFDRHVDVIHARLGRRVRTMVAASHTILRRPRMRYDAVDPGRLLYGLVEDRRAHGFRPVLASVSSTVIQVNRIGTDGVGAIGYGSGATLAPGSRTGVFPLGWYDGLSSRGGLGEVLVRGRRAPVVARTLLHSIIDLSEVADARVGDEVVLIGPQGGERLDIEEVAAAQGVSATELHFCLAGSMTRPQGGGGGRGEAQAGAGADGAGAAPRPGQPSAPEKGGADPWRPGTEARA